MIPKHGGKVLESLPDGNIVKKCIVLSHPCTGFRKQNYLLALARGAPLLHYLFVVNSLTKQRLQDPEQYRLPSGSCPLYPHFVFPEDSSSQFGQAVVHGSQLFAKKAVFNLAGQAWNQLLSATGFKLLSENALTSSSSVPSAVLDPLTTFINSLGDRRHGKFDTVYLLVDPHQCVDTVKASSTGASRSSVNSVASHNRSRSTLKAALSPTSPGNGNSSSATILSANDLQILRELNKSSNVTSSCTWAGVELVVVTLDWFVSCLQLRTVLRPAESALFSLPADVIRRPSVFKKPSADGGERYSVGDVVLYKTSSPQPNEAIVYAVGKIIEFSRRAIGPGIPTLVRLQPVLREKKALTLVQGIAAELVDVSMLDIKVSVFSKEQYNRLAYPASDDHIFRMSDEWEHSHRAQSCESEESGDEGKEDASALPVLRQASQDF